MTINALSDFARTLNVDDLREWNYRLEERIGFMCGECPPDERVLKLAQKEADEAIKEMRELL